MFKDLKEYQEITQLYHDSVNISEEQREINKIFVEADFTAEEIQYLDENFDELWDNEFSILIKEEVSDLTEGQINEIVLPGAAKLIKKGVKAVVKRVPKSIKTGVKDIASGTKEVAKRVIDKAKPVVKKAVKFAKRIPGVALPVAAVGGLVAGVNKLRNIGKDKRIEAEKPKPTETKPPVQIGGVNAGASTDSGGTSQSTIKSVEQKPEVKKPEVSTMTSQGKPRTKAQMMAAKRIASGKTISDVKAENQAAMKARAKAKFAAFKAKRAEKKAGMSEGVGAIPMVAGGIGKALGAGAAALGAAGMMMQSKKNQGDKGGQGFGGEKPENAEVKGKKKNKKPRLNIGKRASGRDRNFILGGGYGESVEYTPYDIVLEYLLSSEQVDTIEEANYVMSEMDAETIQAIVKEGSMDVPPDVKAAAKKQYKAGSPGAEPYTVDDKKTIINYYKNKKGKV